MAPLMTAFFEVAVSGDVLIVFQLPSHTTKKIQTVSMTAEKWIRISRDCKPQLERSARVGKDLGIRVVLKVESG